MGFEPQVTQCQVGATFSSPPGGMDFSLKYVVDDVKKASEPD